MACILWTGAIQNNGYGQIRREGKLYLTHRWFYAQHHGLQMEDIKGKVVRHTCDVRACRNPEHLLIGTQSQNLCDRKSRPGVKYRKLTQLAADAIKVRLAGGEILRTIAADYGVSLQMVHNIKTGKQWA